MDKLNKIIKFEDFNFDSEEVNDLSNVDNIEELENDSIKSITPEEIRNTSSIVTRSFSNELTESLVEDMIFNENMFSSLYNSLKNNVKKIGDIKNIIKGKWNELKDALESLGINRKMSPDEISMIITKRLFAAGINVNEENDVEKSLLTKIYAALGFGTGLSGVLTYVLTTIIGGSKGSFSGGLGDTGGIVTGICMVLAIISGILYIGSAFKDEQRAKMRPAEVTAESVKTKRKLKINEDISSVEDYNTILNSLNSVVAKVMDEDGPEISDDELSFYLSHNGNEICILLNADTYDPIENFIKTLMLLEEDEVENTESEPEFNDELPEIKMGEEKPDPYMGTSDFSKLERVNFKKNKLVKSRVSFPRTFEGLKKKV